MLLWILMDKKQVTAPGPQPADVGWQPLPATLERQTGSSFQRPQVGMGRPSAVLAIQVEVAKSAMTLPVKRQGQVDIIPGLT